MFATTSRHKNQSYAWRCFICKQTQMSIVWLCTQFVIIKHTNRGIFTYYLSNSVNLNFSRLFLVTCVFRKFTQKLPLKITCLSWKFASHFCIKKRKLLFVQKLNLFDVFVDKAKLLDHMQICDWIQESTVLSKVSICIGFVLVGHLQCEKKSFCN